MGVKQLWTLLAPVGRPVTLENLEGKRLAIDSSIWLYQFQATMRDKDGKPLSNAHILGFFRRICKLLFYGIHPVFVFDGGAPILKRSTINERRKRKSGAAASHASVAKRLLAARMRKEALEHSAGRSKKVPANNGDDDENVRLDETTVFLDDLTGNGTSPPKHFQPSPDSKSRRTQARMYEHDPYYLPEVDMPAILAKHTSSDNPDPRLATEDELRAFIEEIRPEDFDTTSPAFRDLPTEVQYEIMGDLRLKSRQTSHKRLQSMLRAAPTPMDFSKAQIRGLAQRNQLTQQILTSTTLMGSKAEFYTIPVRVAAERNRQYMLVKNTGPQGGWVLGIRDEGTRAKPIKVDHKSEDEDDVLEDVVIPTWNAGKTSAPVPDADWRAYKASNALVAISARQNTAKFASKSKSKSKLTTPTSFLPSTGPMGLFSLTDDSESDTDHRNHGAPVEAEEEEDVALDAAIMNSLVQVEEEGHYGLTGMDPHEEGDEGLEGALFDSLEQGEADDLRRAIKESRAALRVPTEMDDGDTSLSASASAGAGPSTTRQYSRVSGRDESLGASGSCSGFTSSAGTAASASATASGFGFASSFGGGLIFGRPSGLLVDDDDEDGTDDVVLQIVSDHLPSRPISQSLLGVEPERERDAPIVISVDDEDDDGDDGMEDVIPAPLSPPPPSDVPVSVVSPPRIANLLREISPLPSRALTPTPLLERQPIRILSSEPKIVDNPTVLDLNSSDAEEWEEVVPPPSEPATAAPLTTSVKEPTTPPIIPSQVRPTEADEDSDPFTDWSRSPSPAALPIPQDPTQSPLHPPPPSQPREDHFDAAHEMDPLAEETSFAAFISTVQNKPLTTVRSEIDAEIASLQLAQKKSAAAGGEDITQGMIVQIQVLLRLFGIPYITAPMEAEAQCAELLELDLVDGIITDDSDVFLFGGLDLRVYRHMFAQHKSVECFLSADLKRELGLDRSALVRLAYLLGSDYTDGVQGVGPVIAMELMEEFKGEEGLHLFREWWGKVQTGKDTKEDTGTRFRKRFKKRFKDLFLAEEWPNPAVRDAYYHPTVDQSEERFKWGFPDLDALRQYLQEELNWPPSKTDETLLPIIHRLNQRKQNVTVQQQGTLDKYFDAQSGTTARRDAGFASKRLQKVVSDFRKARESSAAAATSENGEEKGSSSEDGEAGAKKKPRAKAKGKGKATGVGAGTKRTRKGQKGRRPAPRKRRKVVSEEEESVEEEKDEESE